MPDVLDDVVALVPDASDDAPPGGGPTGGPPGGGPPGGGPALANACSIPVASSDAESVPSPLVSRLEKAALSALVVEAPVVEESVDDVLEDPDDAVLAVDALVSPSAVSMSDRLSEPFDPNWLIRSFARLVAASSRPKVEPEVEPEVEDVEPSVLALS